MSSGTRRSTSPGPSIDADHEGAVDAASPNPACATSSVDGEALSGTPRLVRDWVVRSCATQGVPAQVSDRGVLRKVVEIARLEAHDPASELARSGSLESGGGRRPRR